MRFLSVCSGIEAASVAWSPLGWKAVAFSEIEPFPCAVLAHHYHDTPNWGDMTKYKDWPDVSIDLLCGGTPCQSFSVAGLRKGLDDPRGNLMLTFGAIAAKYRPQWLVWENVPGVLSSNGGADFGAFLGMLGQLGYGFAYRVFDAQYFGVAQRRRRVFVVGCLGDWRSAAAVLFERHSLQGHPAPSRQARQGIAGGIEIGPAGGSYSDLSPTLDTRAKDGPVRNQLAGAVQHGTSSVDVSPTLRAGGNKTGGDRPPGTDVDTCETLIAVPHAAISPALKARDHKGVSSDGDGDGDGAILVPMLAHSLRGGGFDASEDGTGRGTPLVPMFLHTNKGRPDGRRSAHTEMVSVKDIVETLTTDGHAQSAVAVPVAYGIRTANTSSNGWGIQEECTHTLDCAQGVAVAVALRGREGGATAELGDEVQNCLRASSGGGDKPHVLCETLYNKGFNHGGLYASTQETHAGKILRTLREAVGEEAFAQWGLGILGSLQSPEILRQALHGLSIRPAAFSRSWVVHCALSRSENGSGWLLQSLREAGCERCASQGLEPSEQLAGKLGAYLSELSQPGAQAARLMRDLWFASEGVGLLQQALLAVQEVGRSAGHKGQSVLRGSEGRRAETPEAVPSAGMQCEVSRERVLHQACAAGKARDSREGATEQERSGKGRVGETPFAVRRLTVEECEFLQGFPRGYSKIPWRKKPADQCPDGPRYKALGNSWAVPNVRWIGQRIDAVALINKAQAATKDVAELEAA